MEIGRHTYGQDYITVHEFGEDTKLRIGSFCSIYKDVHVILGGNHRTAWGSLYPFGTIPPFTGTKQSNSVSKGDVTIGNDVWLGYGVTIMSGVTIGHGSAVAANSHVVKDVEPFSIIGGNPARLIKKRFSDEQIANLLKYPWWDLDDEQVTELIPLLNSFEVDELIAKLKRIYNA